jgi:hypothetical protein
MLFMIRLSVDVLSYTIGWRMLWGAFVIVLATGLLARTYSRLAAALSLSRWFYEMAAPMDWRRRTRLSTSECSTYPGVHGIRPIDIL